MNPGVCLSGLSFPFFVRSAYAVGRNYKLHAKELSNPIEKEPIIFLKSLSALTTQGKVYLSNTERETHYEAELIVAIGKTLCKQPPEKCGNAIIGLGLGLDITDRTLQQYAKTNGLPWSIAKGIDTYGPLSPLVPITNKIDLHNIHFCCFVNHEIKQKGNTSDMLFPIKKLLSYISHYITLKIGDIIFTGTPHGVGPIKKNDYIKLKSETLNLSFAVTVV